MYVCALHVCLMQLDKIVSSIFAVTALISIQERVEICGRNVWAYCMHIMQHWRARTAHASMQYIQNGESARFKLALYIPEAEGFDRIAYIDITVKLSNVCMVVEMSI